MPGLNMNALRRLGLVATLVASSSGLAGPPATDGDLRCDRQDGRQACVLTWNLAAQPRVHYRVQRYDVASQSWQSLGNTYSSPYASTDQPVRGGTLYRILACDDLERQVNCVGSRVHWALLLPSSPDEIPDAVESKSGGKMLVNKTSDLASQTDAYNVYLLANMLDDIADLASMPPMTRPRLMPEDPLFDGDTVDEEQMESSVYHNYETRRQMAIEEAGASEQPRSSSR